MTVVSTRAGRTLVFFGLASGLACQEQLLVATKKHHSPVVCLRANCVVDGAGGAATAGMWPWAGVGAVLTLMDTGDPVAAPWAAMGI